MSAMSRGASRMLAMKKLDEILAEVKTRLPAVPSVAEVYGYPFTDSLGDPAFRVTIVMAEDFAKEGPQWRQLKPIQDAVFDAFREHEMDAFPYVRFVTSREVAEEPALR